MWFGIMFLFMHQSGILPLWPCVASTAVAVTTFIVKSVYHWINLHNLNKSINELDKVLSDDDDTEDS